MGLTKFFTIKEAKLNNNCPECYSNNGLQLTFKQKFFENAFYKAITNQTSLEIHCNKCNTKIFPVRWTDDLERVVDYQQRAVQQKSKSIKLKPLAWIVIILDLMIVTFIVLLITDVISL